MLSLMQDQLHKGEGANEQGENSTEWLRICTCARLGVKTDKERRAIRLYALIARGLIKLLPDASCTGSA